jgi:hypothetical protein
MAGGGERACVINGRQTGGGERACVINGWGRPAEEGELGSGASLPRHILTR